ncbi:DedA family protein [Ktedonospora formicarum]|uniref:VTT domain-containing protein n=1 Tax=Ktedonospora formicarum TaxID=2778364 RepID=A0A8J3I398_9CHLR|nr:DedA family protein [Ktedonospora formicarum]GHO44674.1 hypothetical protein KSX_28370 [Ktedonospora formicarum]
MQELLPTLLLWLQQFGYPALWLVVFVAAIGLPLPISLIVIVAGTLAALERFNLFSLTLVIVSASVCGDSVGYWLGRCCGLSLSRWIQKHPHNRFLSQRTLKRSHNYFRRHGDWAIFLSRFLASGFGGPVNLLAGLEFYPFPRFLLLDIVGETIGALLPLMLGFFLGANWQYGAQLLTTSSLIIIGGIISLFALSLGRKLLQRYALLPEKSGRESNVSSHLKPKNRRVSGLILALSRGVKRIHKKDKFYTSLYSFASLWRKNES